MDEFIFYYKRKRDKMSPLKNTKIIDLKNVEDADHLD